VTIHQKSHHAACRRRNRRGGQQPLLCQLGVEQPISHYKPQRRYQGTGGSYTYGARNLKMLSPEKVGICRWACVWSWCEHRIDYINVTTTRVSQGGVVHYPDYPLTGSDGSGRKQPIRWQFHLLQSIPLVNLHTGFNSDSVQNPHFISIRKHKIRTARPVTLSWTEHPMIPG